MSQPFPTHLLQTRLQHHGKGQQEGPTGHSPTGGRGQQCLPYRPSYSDTSKAVESYTTLTRFPPKATTHRLHSLPKPFLPHGAEEELNMPKRRAANTRFCHHSSSSQSHQLPGFSGFVNAPMPLPLPHPSPTQEVYKIGFVFVFCFFYKDSGGISFATAEQSPCEVES